MSSFKGEVPTNSGCERLQQALCDCHRRFGNRHERDVVCRHLNRALAICLLSGPCPSESESVRAFCSSAGTAHKRAQCQQAQIDLSLCLSSHQNHPQQS